MLKEGDERTVLASNPPPLGGNLARQALSGQPSKGLGSGAGTPGAEALSVRDERPEPNFFRELGEAELAGCLLGAFRAGKHKDFVNDHLYPAGVSPAAP
ncbi:MAG TPA: hypothetical protein VNM40_02560 [Candidatus Paceibacterota bacterium]|nr:hypothetical protein [Candidatus Paceibacterota bacterium]